jgi:hypothetical protein
MDNAQDPLAPLPTLAWLPLVARPRPPGLPLEARIAELADLAARLPEGTCHQRVSRAAEVLNKAALITSDCGMPATARALCHRQHELFNRARPLPAWAAQLALQPILNIPRQMIREGQGHDAYTVLETLYHAARERATAVIDGQPIDLSMVTSAPDDHKTVCTLIWAALLADGTRALAQAGRWKDAANHAAAHRGTGQRLLDGRQTAILALTQEGQLDRAATMVEESAIAQPWERAVQSLLRALCLRVAGTDASRHVTAMLADTLALVQDPDRSTVVMRIRTGIIVLHLAGTAYDLRSLPLHEALVTTAANDAYAARDILAHPRMGESLAADQRSELRNLTLDSGLRAGTIPERLNSRLMAAVTCAEAILGSELQQERSRPTPRQGSMRIPSTDCEC